jgi:hypothetical protein
VSNTPANQPQHQAVAASGGPQSFTFSQAVLFHLRISAVETGSGPPPIVKYRNFEGAELQADLASGEEIQVDKCQ